jgi:hypothetical protein
MKSNGLATILLMIPALAIPALAIFGIPQFAPVVASPLEENGGLDKEKRIGNSARLSQDELFDDIEAFDSNRPANVSSSNSVRSRNSTKDAPRSSRLRRSEAEQVAAWGDDLEPAAEQQKSNQTASFLESGDQLPIRRSRYERSARLSGKTTSAATTNRTDESDAKISQIGYSDNRENRIESKRDDRPKPESTRNAKPREPSEEDLTWNAAVERLNELEIRNFRLEPGPRLGLFVFICSYTPTDSPSVSYRFESEADQPLKAVQKVLEQIVEWRQRR